MQKIILYFLLLVNFAFAQKGYEACGTTKEEAKANLANQIISTIESSFESQVTVSQTLFSFSSKASKQAIKTHSHLTLSDLKFYNNGAKVCARIEANTLIKLAQGKIKSIKNYHFDTMPKAVIAHINLLESRLDEVNQAIAITKILPEHFDDKSIQLLQSMKEKITTLRSELNGQKVSFSVTPRGATLFVDNVEQERLHNIYLPTGTHSYTLTMPLYAPLTGTFELKDWQEQNIDVNLAGHRYPQVRFELGEKARILLDGKKVPSNTLQTIKPGTHTYKVSIKNHCPLTETFSMDLGQNKSIAIDPDTLTYPELTINSNRLRAKLFISGKPYTLGKSKTFKICKASPVAYKLDFQGQIKGDTITLAPGQTRSITIDFLTLLDIKALKDQARSYQHKKRFTFRTGYDFYGSDKSLNFFGFDALNHRSWLRYGWGLSAASDGNNRAGTLHYTAALQLTDMGAQKLPIHIGSYALMPYIGLQGGIEMCNFNAYKYGTVAKAITGIDFVINSNIGIELFAQKNFMYTKVFRLGVALSLKDPF